MRYVKHKRWRLWLAWAGVIIWCVLCFYLSAQKLTSTTKLSDSITHFILDIFGLPGQTYYMAVFDGFRPAAHVVVFAVFSMLLCWALFETFAEKKIYFYTFTAGIFFSIASEAGKLFVPGRHCSVADMVLNFLGCILGVGLIYIFRNNQ